jgi:hypothetical protein
VTTAFRHADRRVPFLWEGPGQPAGRWHAQGEGPAHDFADTPDGAWAEFLRHEGITSPEDLEGVTRALWAVELPDSDNLPAPRLPEDVLLGGPESYAACQAEARRIRATGSAGIEAPSAALLPGEAAGWRVEEGLRRASARDGIVWVLFGPRPDLIGWRASENGPPVELLPRVRHFR